MSSDTLPTVPDGFYEKEDFKRPNWENPEEYEVLSNQPDWVIRWQFMRRNPLYQETFWKYVDASLRQYLWMRPDQGGCTIENLHKPNSPEFLAFVPLAESRKFGYIRFPNPNIVIPKHWNGLRYPQYVGIEDLEKDSVPTRSWPLQNERPHKISLSGFEVGAVIDLASPLSNQIESLGQALRREQKKVFGKVIIERNGGDHKDGYIPTLRVLDARNTIDPATGKKTTWKKIAEEIYNGVDDIDKARKSFAAAEKKMNKPDT